MSKTGPRTITMFASAALALAGLAVVPASALVHAGHPMHVRRATAHQRKSTAVGKKLDFNGDGFGDVAIGVPGETVNGDGAAGGVNVLDGTLVGLKGTGSQFWSQDSPGIIGSAEPNDYFGSTIAGADFNDDGFDDLAISSVDEGIGPIGLAGSVNVLYGSEDGLTADGDQSWSEDSPGIAGAPGADDQFGWALSARDFNQDGFADLAIGMPGKKVDGVAQSGGIEIILGSASGLTATGSKRVLSPTHDINFGSALVSGNFDGKGGLDLAIGARNALTSGKPSGGAFWMAGGPSGLTGLTRIPSTVDDQGAACGRDLAVGNFNADNNNIADLAIGCPFATVGGKIEAGEVDLHAGGPSGPGTTTQVRTLHPVEEAIDFGFALAGANFAPGTAKEDELAVGVPNSEVNGQSEAGEVVLEGQTGDLQVWSQASSGISGEAEEGDGLGLTVAAGDFNGDGFPDLITGASGESIGDVAGAGGVNVIYGSENGLTSVGNRFFSQATQGVVGTAQKEDFFGSALAARVG